MRHQSGFLMREAFRNLRADRFLSAASVITIGVCSAVMAFLLLGLTLAFSIDGLGIGTEAPLRVFTRSEFEDSAGVARLRLKLEKLGAFDSVVFVSKEEALGEFRRDFGNELLQYLETNPLPYSFRLYPSETPLSAARVRTLAATVTGFEEVEEVESNVAYLEWKDRWRLPLQAGSLLLLAFMGGALALVVHNAIKVSLYARRALVENMKYCGASEAFILMPFALEGALLGLGGSLFGVAALLFLTRLVQFLLPSLPVRASFFLLSLYLACGIVAIAFFSSWRTVRAFFRGHPA